MAHAPVLRRQSRHAAPRSRCEMATELGGREARMRINKIVYALASLAALALAVGASWRPL